MAKPQHKVRPPPPLEAAAFVRLGDAPGATPIEMVPPEKPITPLNLQPADLPTVQQANRPSSQQANKRRVETRKDGRELRKQTLYLPTELYRRLRVYSATNDADMSELTVEALEAFLAAKSIL